MSTTLAGLFLIFLPGADTASTPFYQAELIFPLHPQHNHASGVVECPNGDLLVSWYRGRGERNSDDVAVYGARRHKGAATWSEPFLMADNPGFPDCNTTMFIDAKKKLWLFWPVILDNRWESCLTNYRTSTDYDGDGSPKWNWQGAIYLKPQDFKETMLKGLEDRKEMFKDRPLISKERMAASKKIHDTLMERLDNKLLNRLGWQPRCKPTVLPSGRILLPLYSDTYNAGLMAISDDEGKTWYGSKPLAGYGSIQPAVVRRNDGTLVAYMRENGPVRRIRVSESKDDGITWGPVGAIDLPNPGSGLDAVRLANGNWVLIYNDTTRGRSSLAVSLSDDEGKTWKWTRHLEKKESGSYHYPAIIQGQGDTIHAVYSYSVRRPANAPADRKEASGESMKHAAFNEAWIRAGDG